MTSDEIIRYAMSFLGGGVVVAVGNWVHASISARRQREVVHLTTQLENLYGPLAYFAQQNQQLFNLCKKLDAAYKSEFIDKSWSDDAHTHAAVKADAEATIELSNAYIEQVTKNNERVMEVLEKAWHLVDVEDVNDFAQFQVDFTRFRIEVKGSRKTPFAIYQAVGSISYMRQSMIDRIGAQVLTKSARLRKLLTSQKLTNEAPR
jgi:hypothetical protein